MKRDPLKSLGFKLQNSRPTLNGAERKCREVSSGQRSDPGQSSKRDATNGTQFDDPRQLPLLDKSSVSLVQTKSTRAARATRNVSGEEGSIALLFADIQIVTPNLHHTH